MGSLTTLDDIVRARLRRSADDIGFALEKAREGNPFAAESDDERRQERLQTKNRLSPDQADIVNQEIVRRARRTVPAERETGRRRRTIRDTRPVDPAVIDSPLPPARLGTVPDGRERVWGDTTDFVSVAFLEIGARVARSVGRVAFRNGRGEGTGVLIGEGLFLTNHHVIESAALANRYVLEFDYERDLHGQLRTPTRYAIDASVFVTDPVEGLDFTVVAVGERLSGDGQLEGFGFSGLSDARDKHMIGEFANIVQHPDGRFKEVVLRENRLVNRFDDTLHYVADTEPGSSGSAVYNSEWQMIALHHWGGPWIDGNDGDTSADFDVNEGIRISSIVHKLRDEFDAVSPDARRRIGTALDLGDNGSHQEARPIEIVEPDGHAPSAPQGTIAGARVGENGEVTWTLPVEISVRIPQLAEARMGMPAPRANNQHVRAQTRGSEGRAYTNGTSHGSSLTALPGQLDRPDGRPDDLQQIKGVGARIEGLLNRHGIFHFHQIAAWNEADIAEIDTALHVNGRITRDDWIRQASRLAE